MKLRYIIPSFITALTMMVSCSEEFEPSYQDGLRVSKSYVSINASGGVSDISVTSATDWAINTEEIPEWLTVTPTSSGAGQTKVTFQADAILGSRNAQLHIISSNSLVQEINILQGETSTDTLTVAQAVALVKSGNISGGSVIVRGIVCKINEISASYGNATYFLSDDGSFDANNNLEIYRGAWIDGEKFTKGDEFDLGDELVIKGTLVDYKGQPETPQGGSMVISIKKSLIKLVEPTDAPVISKNGGEVKIKLAYKGIGVVPALPTNASWVHFADMELYKGTVTAVNPTPADTAIVKFTVDENNAEKREATVEFKCTDGSNTSKLSYTIVQETAVANPAKGTGTKNDPFNVTAALAYTKALGDDVKSENDVYVTGIISSVKYTYSAQFGTATYNISVDGNEDNVFTVYGSYYFDNKPWEEGNTQIAVGDVVVVCGKVINYKGTTPEFASKENWLVKLNGASGGSGDTAEPGTLDNPFTPAQALEEAGKLENKTKSESDYYIKGKISSIKYTFSAQYGTAQFNISEDGATTGDQFLVYGTYYLGNRAWAEGDTQIAVGDEVIICGKLTNYNGTLETANKENYIYSLNGKTE